MMKFEKTALKAIRFRAEATGETFMRVHDVELDLGAPADFFDVLASLHKRGLITLHRDSDALSLLERGRRA